MEDVKVLVGNRIKYLRKKLNLTQYTLAEKIGFDRTYLAGVESGKRNVSILNIQKIAKVLKCTIADFFDSDEFKINTPNEFAKTVDKVAFYRRLK